MVIFDEICGTLKNMGFEVSTDKPNEFSPDLMYVHLSDLSYTYESNMTAHMSVELRVEWVEELPNTLDDKCAQIMVSIERRLATICPADVGTFKFRKPDIIHLGTAYKVSLKCTYTKVIDI